MSSSFVIQALKILSVYWKTFLNGLVWGLGWSSSSTARQSTPTSGGHQGTCGIPKNASGGRSRGAARQQEQSCQAAVLLPINPGCGDVRLPWSELSLQPGQLGRGAQQLTAGYYSLKAPCYGSVFFTFNPTMDYGHTFSYN